MALLEEGRVCVKRFGRDAGDKAIVTKVVDRNFVNIISSSRTRERRCNIKHLEFLSEKVDVADKYQVAKALEIEEKKFEAKPKQQPPQPKQDSKKKTK